MNTLLQRIDAYQEEISQYRPFTDKNLLKQIQNFYRIECTWSSNALEGNTYTLSETKVLLEDGITVGGKTLKDALEVTHHAKAFDYMFALLSNTYLTENDIIVMHSLLSGSLENDAVGGEYRKNAAFITGSKYSTAQPDQVPSLIKELIEQQEKIFSAFHTVVAAAKFHKQFLFIHPFGDGNGRIARLAMNALLIQRGYLPISIAPIMRNDYINALEKAHINDKDFVYLLARMELETQKDFCRMLKGFITLGETCG